MLAAPQAPGAPELPPQPPDTSDIVGAVTLPSGTGEVLPAPARPVREGEFLRFSVRYGFIQAGEATLEVPEVKTYKGRQVYSLVARAESNKFFSAFYKVQNRIESYWDETGYYSRRFFENRHEGGYHEQNEILFDYKRGEAVYQKDGQKIPIPPNCQDALSSFYYTRTQALPLGGSVLFDYHASHKSQPIEVKVLGRQKVETPAGTYNCVVIEPILRAAGIFQNRGRLVIWLTDDDRRIPVMMKSKVTIGSISVVLIEARRG
ncbi:MAG TPA: DUF3108 domain-containing protein [Candidatus Eisenbacteria bacterium]|nr:DUF3108 domain-containing protein [Candidatus Eisenbacteria bacterium]